MRHSWVLPVALLLTLVSVERASAREVKPPADLVVSIAIGPDSTLAGARDYMDAVAPKSGAQAVAMMRQTIAEAAGLLTFDGLDTGSSSYLLLVDGKVARGAALFAKISDDKRLNDSAVTVAVVKKQGWALVGPKALVKKLTAYAFGTLARASDPSQPTATIFTKGLLTRYKNEIASARQGFIAGAAAMGGAMGGLFDGMLGTIGESEKLLVTLDATKDTASVDLAVVPRPGTRLAKFVAAQKPSDYALLDKLPAIKASSMMFAGHLEAGPYRQAMLDLFATFSGTMPKEMIAMWSSLMAASTGDLAVVGQLGAGMKMTQILGVADRKAFDGAIEKLNGLLKDGRTFDVFGVKETIKTTPTATYASIPLHGYEIVYDLTGATAEMKKAMEQVAPGGKSGYHMALVDQLGVIAMGGESEADIKRGIDGAKGKGNHYTPSATIADFLAASRARKESTAMVIDFGAMMKLPSALEIMMSLGFADGSAHLRLTLGPELLQLFMMRGRRSGGSKGPI